MNNTDNTALLVIDMQNGFIGSHTEHLIPVVENLVKQWRQAGGDTVFTRFVSIPKGQYERLIGWKRLQSPPETDFCPGIAPLVTNVLTKNYYTAFTKEFRDLIAKNGWQTFGICGIATDSCVLKTAADAFELGYTPFVLADACASHAGNEVHEAAIRILKRFIGKNQVTDSKAFLSAFQRK